MIHRYIQFLIVLITLTYFASNVQAENDISYSLGASTWVLLEGGAHYQEGVLYGPSASFSIGRWTFVINYLTGEIEKDYDMTVIGQAIGSIYSDFDYLGSYRYDRSDYDFFTRYYLGTRDFLFFDDVSFAVNTGLKYHVYEGDEHFTSVSITRTPPPNIPSMLPDSHEFSRHVDLSMMGGGLGIGMSIPLGNPETTPVTLDISGNFILTNMDYKMTEYRLKDYKSSVVGYGTNGFIGLTLQLFGRAYISGGFRGQWLGTEEGSDGEDSDVPYPFSETCGGLYVGGGAIFGQ